MRNRSIPTLSDVDKAYARGLLAHEDTEALIFNKPSGLPVQTRGNRGHNLDHLLWAYARSNGKRPRLVHRIDTGTSGLVLAAKTHPVAVHLSRQFAERKVSKSYLAVVSLPTDHEEAGIIDVPLKVLKQGPPKTSISTVGQVAKTHWELLDKSGKYGLIEARPVTGRMHQIRAHLAYLGMPILGDPLYGGSAADRLMLHALQLSYIDTQGASKTYIVPPAEDFTDICVGVGLAYFTP